jgi:hypothetical protein
MRRFITVYVFICLLNIDFNTAKSSLHLDAVYNNAVLAANWFFNLFKFTYLAPLWIFYSR